MTKLGILSFAHMHAYSYATCIKKLANAELVAIQDEDTERGKGAAQEFETAYYADYNELLARTDLDAVIICSENSRHKELTVAAARHAKHVLCEKPIATTIKDAEAMIAHCNANSVKLQIAFPCRFIPAMKRARDIVASGSIGQVMAIKATNHGKMPKSWFADKAKAGGGAVMDHTVHVVDLIRWITGEEVRTVYAEIGTLLHDDILVDDCGLISMEFKGGMFASLDCSWSRPESFPFWGDVTMEIVGTDGLIRLDSFAQKLVLYSDRAMKTEWIYWGTNMDMGLITDFVDVISDNDRPVTISGIDGLRALEVALAAYESARRGQPVEVKTSPSAID